MKSNTFTILIIASFLFIAGHTTATAQVDTDAILRVHVPFSFAIRNKTYPAGRYIIQSPEDTTVETGMLQIEPVRGKVKPELFSSIPISAPQAPTESNLVFGKINGKYYLSEIWQDDSVNGSQVEEPDMKAMESSGMAKEKQVIRAELSHKKKH